MSEHEGSRPSPAELLKEAEKIKAMLEQWKKAAAFRPTLPDR